MRPAVGSIVTLANEGIVDAFIIPFISAEFETLHTLDVFEDFDTLFIVFKPKEPNAAEDFCVGLRFDTAGIS